MPCKGNHGTFTMFISNRTARVFALIVSKMSLPTSPVGNGVGVTGDDARGVVDAKSRGIGGRIFVLAGVGDRGEASSVTDPAVVAPLSSVDRVPSARMVWV